MENKLNLKFLTKFTTGVLLSFASFAVGCQTVDLSDISISPRPMGSVEDVISPKDRAVINQNLLNQAPELILDDCDRKFPFPISTTKNDPYANAGPSSGQIFGWRPCVGFIWTSDASRAGGVPGWCPGDDVEANGGLNVGRRGAWSCCVRSHVSLAPRRCGRSAKENFWLRFLMLLVF